MAEPDSPIGKLIADRYRVSRRLGGGGMGTVYVAVQEPLGREVALKVVRRELARDARTLERFRREALSLSQAQHPHIVGLYDFGELPDGSLYLAMELVRGDNLRQRLIKRGQLPFKSGIAIVRQSCAALACAHGLGIIHRDLKPENILLMDAPGAPDFVKLVDFGVAKLTGIDELENAHGEQLTANGAVVGTPGYIAPEVSVRGITDDPRSDLYSLGVVWFECLAGRPPFRAPTPTSLMMAHAVDPIPPLPPEVPLPIAGLVQRLLAKAPTDRPSDAEELASLLDHLPGFESGASVPRPPAPVTGPDAATLEDAPRAAPRASWSPPPELSTASAPVLAPAVLPSAAASSSPRVPIAALAAAALLLAAVNLAWWWATRGPPVASRVDAGTATDVAAAGDAGGRPPLATDAGPAAQTDVDLRAPVDAGSAANADAGGRKRPSPKPRPRVPDIYD